MRITARQLRQIIKEELARSIREGDEIGVDDEAEVIRAAREKAAQDVDDLFGDIDTETSASQVKLPGTASTKYGGYDIGMTSTASRMMDRFDSILTIEDQDARELLSNPKVKSDLTRMIDGKYALRMGARGPTVSVVKALIAGALREIHESLEQKDVGPAEKIDLHRTVTRLLLDGVKGASLGTIRAACAAAVSYLGMGDRLPTPTFDAETADAVVLYQIIRGLRRPDAVVGKETITSLAEPEQSFNILGNLNTAIA
jgi:murein L,D-transpeptidase YcbB/YkuD